MLSRAAARRRFRSRTRLELLSSSARQHGLPWRCPAYMQWISGGPSAAASLSMESNRHNHERGPRHSRSLATSADTFSLSYNEPLPFLNSLQSPTPTPTPAPRSLLPPTAPLSDLRQWSRSRPLVIHPQMAGPVVGKLQSSTVDSMELHQNLHACLAVGRFDRAAVIIRRLASLVDSNLPEVLEANNAYLRAMAEALKQGQDQISLKKIQHWFEVEMAQVGVVPNADSFAIMCRVACAVLVDRARERTIRRYLYMAEEAGVLEATMASGEYSEHEWEQICQLRDDVFNHPSDPARLSESDVLLQQSEQSTTPASVPNIIPVVQRGIGLQTLKQGLDSVLDGTNVPYPQELGVSDEQKQNMWRRKRQFQVEEDVVNAELSRWRAEHAQMLKMGINPALQAKSMEATMWEWQTSLERAIKELVAGIGNKRDVHNEFALGYGPYLELIAPEKLAAITITGTLRALGVEGVDKGVGLQKLAFTIGGCLELEAMAQSHLAYRKGVDSRRTNGQARSKKIGKFYKNSSTHSMPKRTLQGELPRPGSSPASLQNCEWPRGIKVQVAATLVTKLIELAKYPVKADGHRNKSDADEMVLKPAFLHEMIWIKGKRQGQVKASPELVSKLTKEPLRCHLAHQLPMLVEPEPWKEFNGGYLRYPAKFMRTKDDGGLQDMYALAAIQKGDMDQVFAGLNVLGKTAWRINRPVFDVMVDAWNSGAAIADFPPANPEFEYPKKPADPADEEAKKQWSRKVRQLDNEKSGLHSQRCYLNLQLEIARAFAKETFYFPHNLDFRGRAYPIPSILNHMCADNARGLLTFANGKELGPTGLSWLKVQVANTFGYDKASLHDREQFAMDHLKEMYDSATNPLSGDTRWWLKAEDPWQCLAACFELKAALDSPDPTKYVSCLPVHQDGTCNGLQHYAALGGDMLGATQVNLVPGKRPADIYSEVARLVQAEIEADEKDGNEFARALHGKISRKVVKQPVMTNVYGVTFVGARAQVHKQLDEIIPNSDNYLLSAYIAKKIFKVLRNMFCGASEIQHWLGACAAVIATAMTPEQIEKLQATLLLDKPRAKRTEKTNNKHKRNTETDFQSSVIWTTPLKLPVVQPYRTAKQRAISTQIQDILIKEPRITDPVLKRKQLQAFPPNFIHSLDATHMILSALKCDEIGLTFAAVHDSFWTHASDVPVMNSVLRDAFVRMHSEDIIGRLAEEFSARYEGCMQHAAVHGDSPLGKRIKALRKERRSDKSWGQSNKRIIAAGGNPVKASILSELMREYQRLELLRSEDLKEREMGEKMITPGSLYAAVPTGSSDFGIPEEDMTAEEVEVSEAILEAATEPAADVSQVKEPKKKKNPRPFLKIWIPLSFPPVPTKGDFDVSMLKQSEYFFS